MVDFVTKKVLSEAVRNLAHEAGIRLMLATKNGRLSQAQILHADGRELSPMLPRRQLLIWLAGADIGFMLGWQACARLQPDD